MCSVARGYCSSLICPKINCEVYGKHSDSRSDNASIYTLGDIRHDWGRRANCRLGGQFDAHLPAYGLNVSRGLVENSVFVDRRNTPSRPLNDRSFSGWQSVGVWTLDGRLRSEQTLNNTPEQKPRDYGLDYGQGNLVSLGGLLGLGGLLCNSTLGAWR